jgi:hypothetical protein
LRSGEEEAKPLRCTRRVSFLQDRGERSGRGESDGKLVAHRLTLISFQRPVASVARLFLFFFLSRCPFSTPRAKMAIGSMGALISFSSPPPPTAPRRSASSRWRVRNGRTPEPFYGLYVTSPRSRRASARREATKLGLLSGGPKTTGTRVLDAASPSPSPSITTSPRLRRRALSRSFGGASLASHRLNLRTLSLCSGQTSHRWSNYS